MKGIPEDLWLKLHNINSTSFDDLLMPSVKFSDYALKENLFYFLYVFSIRSSYQWNYKCKLGTVEWGEFGTNNKPLITIKDPLSKLSQYFSKVAQSHPVLL